MGYTHIERIDVTTKSINNVFTKKDLNEPSTINISLAFFLNTSLRDKLIHGDYVLSLYRSWFSDAACRVQIKLYNATYEGLPITGMTRADTEKPEQIPGENFPRDEWLKKC